LLNPLGEELSALRTSLLPGVLATVAHNQRHGSKHVRVFEVGTTFHPRTPSADEDPRDRVLPREDVRVVVALCGGRFSGRWYEGDQQVDFSDLAGTLEALNEVFGLAHPIRCVPSAEPNLNPYCAAELRVGDAVVGQAGQLGPELEKQLDVQGPVFVAEVSLLKLARQPPHAVRHQSLPRFPGTRRDLAVVADKALPAETIRTFIEKHAGGSLGDGVVQSVRLFDVYAGKPIPPTHVSLAFAIEYRSRERTLTDGEVADAFQGVLKALISELKVEVRQ
jgi:phenylalanyl-tRNA synthetase beta chain